MKTLAFVLLALVALGCGGAPDSARRAVAVASTAVAAAGLSAAPVYAARADECYAASETPDAYRECVGTVDALERGAVAAAAGVLAVEAGLDAWDAGADEGASFLSAAPCAASSLAQLITAMVAVGLELPDELEHAAALVRAFGGACEAVQ